MLYLQSIRPHGSPQELERRRQRAVKMLEEGARIIDVARRIGCSHTSVILWRDTLRRGGARALRAKPASGRPPKLSPGQLQRIPKLLLKGALAWGYRTDLWTTTRIAKVIYRKLHVRYHRAHVSRLLAELELVLSKNRSDAPWNESKRPLRNGGAVAGRE